MCMGCVALRVGARYIVTLVRGVTIPELLSPVRHKVVLTTIDRGFEFCARSFLRKPSYKMFLAFLYK